MEAMRRYHLVYGGCFNKVLTALNMTDVDGKRLLDNTIVLWGGQIANGDHGLDDMKWVLAGRGGESIRTGRWMKCNGVSHQNLFVTLPRLTRCKGMTATGAKVKMVLVAARSRRVDDIVIDTKRVGCLP